MTRYDGPQGGFDAPDGWELLPGVGAAESAREGAFRRSLVLTGEALDPPCEPAVYLERQKVIVPAVLAGVSALAVARPDGDGPWTMSYEVDPPDDEPFAQRQAYAFGEGRVQVLTLTARVDDPHAAELLLSAAATLTAAPPPADDAG